MFTYDAWSSNILKKNTYHLDASKLDSHSFLRDIESIKSKGDFFIDAKVNIAHEDAIFFLEKIGFVWRDIQVTFKGCVRGVSFEENVRKSNNCDIKYLQTIAAKSFKLSRFHRDPIFERGVGDLIKTETINSFFSNIRGDGLYVYEEGGLILGFVLYFKSHDTLVIDNIAVDINSRGKGIAKKLVFGLAFLTNTTNISVTTQLVNLPAQNFYLSLNLKPVAYTCVLHLHGNK